MSERQSTRMFTRMKSKKGDERMSGREASPLAGKTRRSYFRSSLSTSSMGGCSESSKPSEEDAEDSERDRRETAAAATVSLKGVLDFPDVVRKLDGEANEGERHVQLGLAKFMAVLDDAPAKDVLAAMERQWGMDRPGALFSLAGASAVEEHPAGPLLGRRSMRLPGSCEGPGRSYPAQSKASAACKFAAASAARPGRRPKLRILARSHRRLVT